jgi:hypothetical protein
LPGGAGLDGVGLGAAEDAGLQFAQFRARVHAQFGHHGLAGRGVDRQGLGRPPGVVQRAHAQRVQVLPQRMVGDQRGQFRRDAGVLAQFVGATQLRHLGVQP